MEENHLISLSYCLVPERREKRGGGKGGSSLPAKLDTGSGEAYLV